MRDMRGMLCGASDRVRILANDFCSLFVAPILLSTNGAHLRLPRDTVTSKISKEILGRYRNNYIRGTRLRECARRAFVDNS